MRRQQFVVFAVVLLVGALCFGQTPKTSAPATNIDVIKALADEGHQIVFNNDGSVTINPSKDDASKSVSPAKPKKEEPKKSEPKPEPKKEPEKKPEPAAEPKKAEPAPPPPAPKPEPKKEEPPPPVTPVPPATPAPVQPSYDEQPVVEEREVLAVEQPVQQTVVVEKVVYDRYPPEVSMLVEMGIPLFAYSSWVFYDGGSFYGFNTSLGCYAAIGADGYRCCSHRHWDGGRRSWGNDGGSYRGDTVNINVDVASGGGGHHHSRDTYQQPLHQVTPDRISGNSCRTSVAQRPRTQVPAVEVAQRANKQRTQVPSVAARRANTRVAQATRAAAPVAAKASTWQAFTPRTYLPQQRQTIRSMSRQAGLQQFSQTKALSSRQMSRPQQVGRTIGGTAQRGIRHR